MSILKRHISTRELYGECLTFIPSAAQLDQFEADMKILNPTMLRDSLKEAAETRKLQGVPSPQQRRLIHRIYARKINEMSSMYPYVFTVENSLRSALAEHLGSHFDRLDWWVIVRDFQRAGKDPSSLGHIRGKTVNARFLKSVWRALENIVAPEKIQLIDGPDKTDEFFYCTTLGDIWEMTRADWSLTRGMFSSDQQLGYKLDQTMFNNTMRLIKDARNELFHSNPIKNRARVVEACERILDALDVHLGDLAADLAAVSYVPIAPSVARTARHLIPAR